MWAVNHKGICFPAAYDAAKIADRLTHFVSNQPQHTVCMVNQTILNKALVEQYDMITSLIDGEYSVVIGDPEHFQGNSIFPKGKNGNYSRYVEEQVIPLLYGTEKEKAAMAKSLQHETVVTSNGQSDSIITDYHCSDLALLSAMRAFFLSVITVSYL